MKDEVLVVSDTVFYGIADAVGMTIAIGKNGQVTCSGERTITIGDLKVLIRSSSVSVIGHTQWAAMIFRSIGNLAFLVLSDIQHGMSPRVTVCILDLAKMGAPEKLMEQTRPATVQAAMSIVAKATVKVFSRQGTGLWEEVRNDSKDLDRS